MMKQTKLINEKQFKKHLETYSFLKDTYVFDKDLKSSKLKRHRRQYRKYGFNDRVTWNLDYACLPFIHYFSKTDRVKSIIKEIYLTDDNLDLDFSTMHSMLDDLFYQLFQDIELFEDIDIQFKILTFFDISLRMYDRVNYIDMTSSLSLLLFNKVHYNPQQALNRYLEMSNHVIKHKKSKEINILFNFLKNNIRFFWW